MPRQGRGKPTGAKHGGRRGARGAARKGSRAKQSAPARRDASKAAVVPGLPRYHDAWTASLAPGKSTAVAAGHPWIFSGAIAALQPPLSDAPQPGQACVIVDHRGFFLGTGYCNTDSQISVRVVQLAHDDEPPEQAPDLNAIVNERLAAATRLRSDLGLTGAERGAHRLCNGAGDGLPGLAIDRYADGAVVSVSTAGAAAWLPGVVQWLRSHGCAWVVSRAPVDAHPSEGLARGILGLDGDVPGRVEVQHHGLTLSMAPRDGAKTGLFTDQWDNHLHIAAMCRDKFVVDAYCHVGGFGLHAAHNGARRVLAVDASQRACDAVEEAAGSAGLSQVEVQCADAVHVLRNIADSANEAPGVVIIDPPKFATRGARADDALRKYTHLNATAMQALAPDGLLVSCSCSGKVDEKTFLRMLAHAARRAGRELQLLEMRGAGRDHPTAPAHAEGRYLKVAVCRVLIR